VMAEPLLALLLSDSQQHPRSNSFGKLNDKPWKHGTQAREYVARASFQKGVPVTVEVGAEVLV